MSERKAFNFYLSFYEVFNEIEKDKDKLAFIKAVLDRQFTGVETELTGQAKFAYISQKQVIDQQIKGWEDKMDKKLQPPEKETHQPLPKGGAEGGQNIPTEQEKGQVQEKEEGEGKGGVNPNPFLPLKNKKPSKTKVPPPPDHPLITWLKENCPDVMKMKQPLTNDEAKRLLQDYPDRKYVKDQFLAMENYAPLRKNNKSANLTFRKWSEKDKAKQETPTAIAPLKSKGKAAHWGE